MNLKVNNYGVFVIIVFLNILISVLFNQLLVTKEVFVNTYSNLNYNRIERLFEMQVNYLWIGYLFIPVVLIVKIIAVSLTLHIGLLVYEVKLIISKTIRVVLIGEFIFLLPQIIKFCKFYFEDKAYTLSELQQFYPLSLLHLLEIDNLPFLWVYPLSIFSLFQVLYWFILAYGLKEQLRTDIDSSLKMVFTGYVPALILWVIIVMFITTSILPSV